MEIKTQTTMAVANFAIELALKQKQDLSYLKLCKVLFFLQGYYLDKHKQPLMDCKFKSYPHGVLNEEIIREFKFYGPGTITSPKIVLELSHFSLIKTYQAKVGLPEAQVKELEKVTQALISKPSWQLVKVIINHRTHKDPVINELSETLGHGRTYEYAEYTNSEIEQCFADNKKWLLTLDPK
ncbi:Panacea domain-containing protein [Ligilactobacillus salivarius]|uniref:Panacea domain-containing protein n=1 Tax=Ligilactobacillus salivarius TaxID=1624 RepID=UPI00365D8E92